MVADLEPRIFFERLKRKEDAAFFDVDDLCFQRIVHLNELLRIVDELVVELGDVDHAFDLRVVGEADEDAEVGGAGHHAVNDLADRVGVEQFFDVCREHFALGDDHLCSCGD